MAFCSLLLLFFYIQVRVCALCSVAIIGKPLVRLNSLSNVMGPRHRFNAVSPRALFSCCCCFRFFLYPQVSVYCVVL